MADPIVPDVGVSATERELQGSSESFLIDLAQLEGLELQKRQMAADDPLRAPLARQIEHRTLALVVQSRYQSRLIDIEWQSEHPGSETTSRQPVVVAAEWREAERRLRDARTALDRATDVAERLRDEHWRAVRHDGTE